MVLILEDHLMLYAPVNSVTAIADRHACQKNFTISTRVLEMTGGIEAAGVRLVRS